MSANRTPALSAILVVADDFASLRQVLSYLAAQTISKQIEVILVGPGRTAATATDLELANFHCHQMVIMTAPTFSVAEGYAAGIRQARAPVVVLCEDHSFPEPDWAEHLLQAHEQHFAVVGPAVRNGNPQNYLSWADFFMGYGEWAYPTESGVREHLPGHNSSYKRSVLLDYEPYLHESLEAESVLHWDMRQRGHELYLESSAVTQHLNFALFSTWAPLHIWSGRRFAATRASKWSLQQRLMYTCASPLIPLVRFRRSWSEVRKPGRYTGSLPGLGVSLMLGLMLDALGQMFGYAFGIGDSRARTSQLEMVIEKRMGSS